MIQSLSLFRNHKGLLRRSLSLLSTAILLLGIFGVAPITVNAAPIPIGVYQNPLSITIPGDGKMESCADPSIIYGQTPGDKYWYIYCTSDPLNAQNRDASGNLIINLIPTARSKDLVNWQYVGNVFKERPAWVAADAGLWAPDIHYFNGKYYLYYAASGTNLADHSSAIGVATASKPTGPWTDSGAPVVEPSGFWTFDPAIIQDDSGQRWIYYGSYFGGVKARKLSADGLHSDPATQVQITIPNRYEGTFVIKRFGYYYLFGSATNCCNGPLTGYSVFVGRSKEPTGPFVDRDGISLLDSRVGGTPVISMNGNRWVGPGHNAVFTDFAGQDWFLYHAIDRNNPYLDAAKNLNRRPALMDVLIWKDGWPSVRGGLWASDTPQVAPAAQPGSLTVPPLSYSVKNAEPGTLYPQFSDEFNGTALGSQWSWVRPPDSSTYRVQNGNFEFDTQNADIYVDSNNASVLLEPAPPGNYLVEVKVSVNVPRDGCCYNYVQGGLVIYADDDNFIKLADVSIWETRQTEFAKELKPVPQYYPRYGNTVGTAPGDWAYLRIVRRVLTDKELYTAYTSTDGVHWNHDGTWTHNLGNSAKIGLVSMGGSGYISSFDYVRVYTIK